MNNCDKIKALKKEIEDLYEQKYKLFDIAPKVSESKMSLIESCWFNENITPINKKIKEKKKEISKLFNEEANYEG